jgi:branched-chain amino acid transport system permease protein
LSSFFAGVAGALAAINFEIVNSAYVGLHQSGVVLLAAFIGGIGYFIGPIIGAILVTYLQTMLSDVTEIWQLYFGLLFIGIVMFAPGGIAGLLVMHGPLLRAGTLARLAPAYLLAAIPALAAAIGAIALIEMVFHLLVKAGEGSTISFFGWAVHLGRPTGWIIAVGLFLGGLWALKKVLGPVRNAWHDAVITARERGYAV